MEPPPRSGDLETVRDEKVKVLKGIPAIEPVDIVRGQYRGYRQESGVAPDSTTETFVALRLHVNSWRWQGVPFFIRAGKNLPMTRTVVVVRFHRPPSIVERGTLSPNYFRFRLSPEFVIALGVTVRSPGDELRGQEVELELNRVQGEDLEPYEELLGDALAGDSFRFARQDYVEEAWRIVDRAIQAGTPVYPYEPGTWGPKEADELVPGGWFVATK
jgi:glucose-6-phosphate 1-dehydrogenase